MKKVRFESPFKDIGTRMDQMECHSPRPFIEKLPTIQPDIYPIFSRPLPYNPDPIQRFENSNSSPYPLVNKTSLNELETKFMPSNELNLSILDGMAHEPLKPLSNKHVLNSNVNSCHNGGNLRCDSARRNSSTKVLSSIENLKDSSQPKPNESKNFFLQRNNLDKFHIVNVAPLQDNLNKLHSSKENDPLAMKTEMMRIPSNNVSHARCIKSFAPNRVIRPVGCLCHHCNKPDLNNSSTCLKETCTGNQIYSPNYCHMAEIEQQVPVHNTQYCINHSCTNCEPSNYVAPKCGCNGKVQCRQQPQNAIDKKTWMLEKFEQSKDNCLEVHKPKTIAKEKREPTVADLFKIIKLQNEQLQLLQEKVDKFISASNNQNATIPIQNFMSEHVAIDSEEHKISIGVMTSFEMVRTSTVINKEIITQTEENAQIHCNRSQISIKEVVSKAQPVNANFLDGIVPVSKTASVQTENSCNIDAQISNALYGLTMQSENINDEKTLNELSLYNVQIDNATTPHMSPEQSLYLDVRDYSDSESGSGSDDQSNVGWTYYNKVMTHVNGMLHDSDMPSSASALYRNTRQHCVQMQIDKTNVSVTKRVKFGDDPFGIRQPHIYSAPTDVSLKMNQLAAKYLDGGVRSPPLTAIAPKPMEMSFATRNYMERHRILQGGAAVQPQHVGEIPKFLDITALKRQPKLL